jgi:type I restriction enzyme S subunit
VYAIFPGDVVYPLYLFQYLHANRAIFAQNAVGSTVKSLRLPIIKAVDVLLPPLAEQKKVAEILSAVDLEVQKTEEIIVATETLKKGLVSKLFSDHVTSNVDEGVPFYRSTEIIKKSKGIPVTNPLYISAEKFDFFKDRFGAPEAGDLLITAVGTIGDVYFVQKETFYFKDGNTVWLRKMKESVLSEYLTMILSSSFYREKLNSIAGGSSQKALTIEKLENVEVPIPSIPEQEKLVKILSAIDSKISVNKRLKEQYTLLKKGLMQDLLSGAKRTI